VEYTTLGRTELRVSVAGLGCGGFSRLGLSAGKSEADAIAIIRQAADLGVNLFDTAAAYGTEAVFGKAVKPLPRDRIVICTKAPFSARAGEVDPASIIANRHRCASSIPTTSMSHQLHGVPPANYAHALEAIAPSSFARRRRQVPPPRHHRRPRRTTFSTTRCAAPPRTAYGTSSWLASR
jgi:aryl-alcohol dehydrogenase-like predicted oxidoreductase